MNQAQAGRLSPATPVPISLVRKAERMQESVTYILGLVDRLQRLNERIEGSVPPPSSPPGGEIAGKLPVIAPQTHADILNDRLDTIRARLENECGRLEMLVFG